MKKGNEIKLRSSYRWFLCSVLFRDVRVTDCLNRHQLQKHFYLSDTFLPLPTSLERDDVIPFGGRHWPEGFTKKRLSARWMRACFWLVSALPLLTATLGSLAPFAGNNQGGSPARAATNAWMLLCLVFFLLLFVCILRLSFRDASLLRTGAFHLLLLFLCFLAPNHIFLFSFSSIFQSTPRKTAVVRLLL